MKTLITSVLVLVLLVLPVAAQPAEVKITLNEHFFDSLLEAVFTKLGPPSVSIGSNAVLNGTGSEGLSGPSVSSTPVCDESVTLKREIGGVRTAVRFRGGKIYAPIAFVGNYNPPLVGCIEFQGWAETNFDLVYDSRKRAIVGNVRVLKVNLSGTNGLGGELIARLVQSSIDRKINPMEIINVDKLSFTVPVKEAGKLEMKALSVRHEVGNGELDIYISYDFEKAP